MNVTRHRVDYWIKNNSIDASIKDIYGPVSIHWHEFYEIELILEGGGIYNIDGIDYTIERGSLYFMSPSSFHHINFKENTKLINIMFTADVCYTDFLWGIFDSIPHISTVISQSDVSFFKIIAENMVNTQSIKFLSAMLNCILGKIQELNFNNNFSFKNEGLQRAVLYIQNHFRENIYLEDVAKVSNYSPNYFNNKFKEYTGFSFKNYAMNLKLSFAEKLIKNTDLSINEICYKSGFKDYSNFMTYFKKVHGITPIEYRKNFKIT